MFSSKARAYSSAPLLGRLLVLPTNIKLGWKGLAKTTALACYKDEQITAVKMLALNKKNI